MALVDSYRAKIEKFIDTLLDDPLSSEEGIKSHLLSQGIEPTLETVLAHVSGYLLGNFFSYYNHIHERSPNKKESDEFNILITRRAREIRDAFIRSRMDV